MNDNYKGRKNYLTGNVLSDEWYTPLEVVEFIKNNINTKNKKVMCPFDSEHSNFAKVFPNSIHNIRDFMEKEYDYDICITNPPFSFKFDIVVFANKSIFQEPLQLQIFITKFSIILSPFSV